MREVIIYGIRAVAGVAIVYVGATVKLAARKRSGYEHNSPLSLWLSCNAWEYVELQRVPAERAVDAETEWIARLTDQGHALYNIAAPSPVRRFPVAPANGGSRRTDAEWRAHGYGRFTLRTALESIRMLNELARLRGISRTQVVTDIIRRRYAEQRAIDARRTK